jgi:hypothetical protein
MVAQTDIVTDRPCYKHGVADPSASFADVSKLNHIPVIQLIWCIDPVRTTRILKEIAERLRA